MTKPPKRKKQSPYLPPKPKAQKSKPVVFRYYAEELHATETQAMTDRLNEIGACGWELLFFSGNSAWFIGDDRSTAPPLMAGTEPHEQQS